MARNHVSKKKKKRLKSALHSIHDVFLTVSSFRNEINSTGTDRHKKVFGRPRSSMLACRAWMFLCCRHFYSFEPAVAIHPKKDMILYVSL